MHISDIMFNEISGYSQEKLDILLSYPKQIQYQLVNTMKIQWNWQRNLLIFIHIVNVKTVRGVKTITILEGYKVLLIYPPAVLLEGDDEDDDETDSE